MPSDRALLTKAINRLTELERTLEGAGNRLTELEAECEHLRAKGLAEYGGRYEEFERAERLREALEQIETTSHTMFENSGRARRPWSPDRGGEDE